MSKKLIPAYLLTLVNVLGFSILMPILPFVVEDYGAPKWVFGLLLTLYSLFQFFGAPWLGNLSDATGRKRVLLISQAGTLLSWIIFIFAFSLPDVPIWGIALPLWIIAISRILDGATGGNSSVTNAYVSDITTRKEKSYIFGYLGGIAGLGMIVGPGLGGLAASTSIGYTGTLYVSALISIITLITIFLWLKESHPVELRGKSESRSLTSTLFVLKRIREVDPPRVIKTVFALKFFFSAMMAFYVSTIALYLIDLFHFTESTLGIFMFFVGLFLSINQAFVSKIFVRKFGEYRTLIIGLILCGTGLVLITTTSTLWVFICCYYVLNLGLSLCFPVFNSLLAIHADGNNKGEIMGISESINSLSLALFPVLSAALYGWIGFPIYYFVALLPLIALMIALRRGKPENIETDQKLSI